MNRQSENDTDLPHCPYCQTEHPPGTKFCSGCGNPLVPDHSENPPAQTGSELAPGFMLGKRFVLLGKLGEGGMGIVFKARDIDLDEIVALKILRDSMSGDSEMIARFKREIKLARKIRHPNVCGIYEFMFCDNRYIIAMEYIDGLELTELIREGTLPEHNRIPLIAGITLALRAAHRQNIVHRDLKPSNILVNAQYRPVIMDFGIARVMGMSNLTHHSRFLGTPYYLAPEQARGDPLDQRTDIYSLGIIMYQLYTGTVPFKEGTPIEVALKHINSPVIAPGKLNESLDPEIESVILKCLEKNPYDRFQSTDELLNALKSMASRSAAEDKPDKPLILVVDDDKGIRGLLEKVLKLRQLDVMTASNGEEALIQVQKRRPSLILMDLVMPKMDGYRTAELLGKNPATAAIPIFLVTSMDGKEYRAYSKAIGIREYITKPFNIPELIEKIKLYLSLSPIS
ncbi:protein kinase [bacterium]|nr:protein kinase [candidate division CSSED10-310 bacterium]